MPSNSFGDVFRMTTWGESHGEAIGVVIDGCPAGLSIDESMLSHALQKRKPGKSPYTSPRKEEDTCRILSGVFEGKTTGAPISLILENQDVKPSSYQALKAVYRPGHANYTYLHKYGLFDYRGGGRSSARETACRVAAGAIAKEILRKEGIEIIAFIHELGGIQAQVEKDLQGIKFKLLSSELFCPDLLAESAMKELLEKIKEEGDSLGGVVALITTPLPIGLGDPVYEKLEANLAKAMLSIPASKGFEIGEGFASASSKGSLHNDAYHADKEGKVSLASNHSGGTLGGISNGEPLWLRVAFKPTSSIQKEQQTTTLEGQNTTIRMPEGSRHDPCVALRAVAVVEAMAAIVLVDALLKNRLSQIGVYDSRSESSSLQQR